MAQQITQCDCNAGQLVTRDMTDVEAAALAATQQAAATAATTQQAAQTQRQTDLATLKAVALGPIGQAAPHWGALARLLGAM